MITIYTVCNYIIYGSNTIYIVGGSVLRDERESDDIHPENQCELKSHPSPVSIAFPQSFCRCYHLL